MCMWSSFEPNNGKNLRPGWSQNFRQNLGALMLMLLMKWRLCLFNRRTSCCMTDLSLLEILSSFSDMSGGSKLVCMICNASSGSHYFGIGQNLLPGGKSVSDRLNLVLSLDLDQWSAPRWGLLGFPLPCAAWCIVHPGRALRNRPD